jgi:hypothetical protein
MSRPLQPMSTNAAQPRMPAATGRKLRNLGTG